MRTVKQLMKRKVNSFNTISPRKLVIEALNMLGTLNVSYLVVMQDEEYKGIFSERDYCRNVILKGLTSNHALVNEVMTSDYPVVSPADTIEHCLNTMNSFNTRYLLVFDDEKFTGAITIHDLLRQVLQNKEQAFDQPAVSNLIAVEETCRA